MELLLERAKKQGKAKKRSFLRKHIVQLGGHAVASVSRTVVHRATKGPIFPNFSVRNELFYQLMLELVRRPPPTSLCDACRTCHVRQC
jgi:trans-2-enoyl-CoA reductase